MSAHPIDLDQLQTEGYQLVPNLFTLHETLQFKTLLADQIKSRAGTRNLLDIPEIRTLAQDPRITALVENHLQNPAVCVRAILFDKTPDSNWLLPFHQDRAIAVDGRITDSDWKGWSVKEGIPHVLPPAPILEKMLAVRLHLDPCGIQNAPLRLIPKSHRKGIVDLDKADTTTEVIAVCDEGDALLMKPLTLHASSKSETPEHRRVVHLEYSSAKLPNGLTWHFA